MRLIILLIFGSTLLFSGISPIKNVKKQEEQVKENKRYKAYKSKQKPSTIVIIDTQNEKEIKISNKESEEITIYEDNGSYMIPTGVFKVRAYDKAYIKKEDMAKKLSFEECDTVNGEDYTCKSNSNQLHKKIIMNKFKLEEIYNVYIEIEYVYLFK